MGIISSGLWRIEREVCDSYLKISKCQDNINIKKQQFQNDTREHLKQVVESNDDHKINNY